jgi:hypothetical protein
MVRYLLSFDEGAMAFPEAELPDVAETAHATVWKPECPQPAASTSYPNEKPFAW